MSFDPLTLKIFVPNFSEDRMTDLIASISKKELLEFTLNQAVLHGMQIDFSENDYGYYWEDEDLCWRELIGPSIRDEENKAVLLTPKDLVVEKYVYSSVDYMNKIILPVLQEKHLKENSELVRKKVLTDGSVVSLKPTLKMLYEHEVTGKYEKNKVKNFSFDRTIQEPEYYFEYDNKVKLGRRNLNLTDEELNQITK